MNIQFLEPRTATGGRRLDEEEVAFALEYEIPPQVANDGSTEYLDKVSLGLNIAMGILFIPNLVMQIFM